jgi:hypothetical protein
MFFGHWNTVSENAGLSESPKKSFIGINPLGCTYFKTPTSPVRVMTLPFLALNKSVVTMVRAIKE